MQQQPILIWNTVRSAWEKPLTENLLCEHLEVFSETWQTSGMMRNGQVFALPMQVLHTTDTESLSSPILRSPKASEGQGGALGEAEALKRGNTVGVRDQIMDLVAGQGVKVSRQLLPTTLSTDWKNGKNSDGYGQNLPETAASLPTPATRDYKDGSAEHIRDGKVQTDTVARAVFNSGEVLLPTTRTSMKNGATQKEIDAGNPKHRIEAVTNWGKFEPAIKRWEAVIGRPAPEPTKPDGKENAHRLSSRFTEWMMGVPEGWITDVGLSRNDELKACGNGVVPQQAELALKILLEGVSFDSERGGGQTVLPTPTVMDQREGKSFRSVAVKNLKEGFNRGLNLNNVTEAGLLDWNEGDKFEIVDGKVQKIDQSDS